MKKIAIFGDSFVEGVGDFNKNGWACRLREKISVSYDFFIDGLGARNVSDVKKQVLSYFKTDKAYCVIINVGINDSRFRESKSGLEISPDEFYAIYTSIINLVFKKGVSYMFLLGLSRVDENIVLNYKPDKSHTNDNAEKIDRVVASLANGKTIIYVPIANIIRANQNPNTLHDGLHPNSTGHDLICEAVLKTLLDYRIVKLRGNHVI